MLCGSSAKAVNPSAANNIGDVKNPITAQNNARTPQTNCFLNKATIPVITANGTKIGDR